MRDPILITGAARSGTSLVTGMIHNCGAKGGQTNGPTQFNKRGQFENTAIRDKMVKPYLRDVAGVDPLGQYPLPDTDTLSIPRDWRSRVEELVEQQGVLAGDRWYYKGAKLCLMWPVWAYAFPNAKWVIVRRRTGDVARSCCNTGFMQAFNAEQAQKQVGADSQYEAWIWWVRRHEERFREMIEAGLNCKVVWPERMVYGDYQQMYETIEWLGLDWSTEALQFIDPKLWRSRQKGASGG